MPSSKHRLLVIDDEPHVRFALDEALRSWGYECFQAGNVAEVMGTFADEEPAAALLDIDLPDGSGFDILNQIKERQPDVKVVMITGNVNVPNAVTALRGGAHDFIGKPNHLEELRVTVLDALETRQLRREVKQIRTERTKQFAFERIIGDSPTVKKAIGLARRVAASDVTAVLLQDETGTGKAHLPADMLGQPNDSVNLSPTSLPPGGIPLETVGFELAKQALARTGGNLTQPAKLLDIPRDQLRYKLRKAEEAAP